MNNFTKKKALVLTYHVKNCTRVGGFHNFIDFLAKESFDIDWVTVTVSLSWLFRNNDKENKKNFIDLWKGIEFDHLGVHIRHFSCPVWIPAKIAKSLHLQLGTHYWPKWKKLRKRLRDSYDVILVEGSACQYAEDLRNDYPNSKVLYRPSDILSMFSEVPEPEKLEKKMIDIADKTLCIDETCADYYKKIAGDNARIEILRNPITTDKDIDIAKAYKPVIDNELQIVYIGVSYIDVNIVEYAAKNNPNAKFIMIGPLGETSHDNIVYTGVLTEDKFNKYLERACIGINPLNPGMIHGEKGIAVGYTRKIINYMKYLMPVVATCSTNYLNIDGFFCVNTKEEFSNKISECLKYTVIDREKLRDGYLYAMKVFSEEESKKHFVKLLNE